MKKITTGNYLTLAAVLAAVPALMLVQTGCTTMAKIGATVGQATGTLTAQQAESMVKSAEAIAKTFEDITPQQEYYLGRAVGATIVSQYDVYENDRATEYVNLLGKSIAKFSDMPETFSGYHFMILDSEEVNAFAAPSGFIFLTRGMLSLCETEDDLAAVIAHEIAHIQLKHAVKAIDKGRLNSALTTIALESAKSLGGSALASVTEAFEGSINDMADKLMNKGYARGQEYDADKDAVAMLKRIGYRQQALIDVLVRMDKVVEHGGGGFGSTHPPPTDRIADLEKMVDDSATPEAPKKRQSRFDKAMKKI